MFYSVNKTETFSPAESLSCSTEGLLREEREEPGYTGVLQQKPGSQNIQRLLLIKENRTLQVS